jgi:hypothetical protein
MKAQPLQVSPGRWVAANCASIPSEKNCKLVIMAPVDQRQGLIDAATSHAVKAHGHKDTPELRAQLDQMIQTVTVE